MKSFHTSESRASDALLDGSLSENDEDNAELSDEALRLARIDEYQRNALHEEEDDLVASFGVVTGGALKILQRLEKATSNCWTTQVVRPTSRQNCSERCAPIWTCCDKWIAM